MPMVEIHLGRRVLQECISQECEGRAKGVLARCPECKRGDLLERRSPRGKRFVSCTSYPDCKNSYPLPQYGKITSKGVCEHCAAPRVLAFTHRGPWEFCVNLQCPERLARQARREERAKEKVNHERAKARRAKLREKKRKLKQEAAAAKATRLPPPPGLEKLENKQKQKKKRGAVRRRANKVSGAKWTSGTGSGEGHGGAAAVSSEPSEPVHGGSESGSLDDSMSPGSG
jgi:ssDNA-binding Zn-finger/Zn-ribbon topoisomerase 1